MDDPKRALGSHLQDSAIILRSRGSWPAPGLFSPCMICEEGTWVLKQLGS
jgi:hypothetical protein